MPDEQPQVILSAFADEAANQQTAVQQFCALAAAGLQYYSLRFIDVGSGVKNVLELSKADITKIRHLEDEYGLNVTSIGSPLGKIKLLDQPDGAKRDFVPFKKYLAGDVKRACELAHAFETKLIRGFSFYPPRGADPKPLVAQAVDQLGQIAEACHRSDLTFGLEIEAGTLASNGEAAADIYRQVNHPALMLVFDAGNIISQGYTPAELFQQYLAMKPGIGWMHVKDYRHPQPAKRQGHRNGDAQKNFVPVDIGDSAFAVILRDFREHIPALEKKLQRRGIPGVFLDLEPHLKGGGPASGFSGPDGLGVATRSLCRVLDLVNIGYHLRDFDDVLAARGDV
jgi:sugar phosphate isomerase/epimerase